MRNWEAISLERVCQIAQCPRSIKAVAQANSVKNGDSNNNNVNNNNNSNNSHSSGSSSDSEESDDSEEEDSDEEDDQEPGEAARSKQQQTNGDLVKNKLKRKLESSENDSTTVYEILSNVLSFSSILIKVTLK
jgi:hypothetical protein